MRTCPNCNHQFDDRSLTAPQCPSCGRAFTVSDVGAATLDLTQGGLPPLGSVPADPAAPPPDQSPPAPGKALTVSDIGAATMDLTQPIPGGGSFPGVPSAAIPPGQPAPSIKPQTVSDIGGATLDLGPGAKPAGSSIIGPPRSDATGMTIQSGRWSPSAAELAEAAKSAPGVLQTIDSSILGVSAGRVSGVVPASNDATGMWDSSHVLSESAVHGLQSRSGAGAPPAGPARSAPGRGSIVSQPEESLERSLVIQPRVLRQSDTPAPTVAGARIDYNLLKKLGEGGMGIVYAARQQSIRRVVALKMLKNLGDQQSSQREKFLAEAVITGDLEHPNIVPIYDLGRDESGAIFYAMKHVKGTPWDKLIQSKAVHENLDILMKVADAVAFAHSREVIHRDLKPENIMLGDFGEVLVMDWGLALSLANPPATVAMGGTPAYMAPEMAMGPLERIGFPSDVYLLGAILFEIVTGQRPHSGATVTRCLMAAAKNEIVTTPKTGELVEIALKAMATKTHERYQTVPEFQDAVRLYQSHTESIALAGRAQEDLNEARRTDAYETYARALFAFQEAFTLWDGNHRAQAGVVEAALAYAQSAQRRGDLDLGLSLLDAKHPQHAALISELQQAQAERESRQRRLRTARRVGVALVAAIFLIVTGAFFWIRNERNEAVRQKDIAEEQTQVAEKQTKIAEEQTKVAQEQKQVAEEQKQVAEEQRTVAVAAREEAVKQKTEAEQQRAAAVAARKEEEYQAYVARIGLAAAKIEENAFDHALELISQCPPDLRHWEWGRLRYLCSRDLKSYDCGQPLEALAIAPDGQRFAAGGWGGEIRLFSVETGEKIAAFPSGASYVFGLAFSPDGKQLAAGTNAKPDYVSLWDADTGQRLRNLSGHADAVLSIVYSHDGKQLLTGSYDNTARLWDLAAGTSRELIGHDWWVWSAAFSVDDQRIVTASQDGSVMVWNTVTLQPSPPFLGHAGPVYSAAFSPDGRLVASGGYDKRVLLWRPDDLKAQKIDKLIAAGADAPPPTPFVTLEGHSAGVRSVRFSSDGRLLATAGNDNAVRVWDVASRQSVKTLRGHASRVSSVAFAPGDERVLTAGYDHYAKLWNISGYEEVRVLGGRVLKGHRDSILGAAFSPDGAMVVTASRDRSAIAWDVATGQQLRSFEQGHAYLASAALFFPDGKHVLTAAVDNTARIWDMTAGTQVATLDGTGTSAAVAIAPAGDWIATGSDDNSIKIWDAAGAMQRKFSGSNSGVTALAVSPDGQFLLAGDNIGRVRYLRADSGQALWESRTHSRAIRSVGFLPGGKRALTASIDNTVAQWDLATGREDQARVLKHPQPVVSLAVSTDGRTALTASADQVVRLWDLDRAQVTKTLTTGTVPITGVALSPDGRRAMSISNDNRLRLWDLATGSEIPPPGEAQGAFLDLSKSTVLIWSGAFSADGQRLLTAGGAEAHLWDAAAAKSLMAFSPQSAVSSVQFSKSGQQLVMGSWDNAARIWNTATGAALLKLSGVHTRFVNASVFSPDGSKVLTASDDGTARLWDATTGKPLGSFVGHAGRVTDVAYSADGKWVLTASDDKTARIWDAESGQVLHVLGGHTQAVLCAKFSADGRRVITGSDDTTAKLWDAATGQALPITLAGHTASVTSVAFSPDGLRALTGSKDVTAKLWDPLTGKEILTLTGHTQEITTVAVSPDGSSVLTGSRDGTAIVWLAVPWKDTAAVALSRKQ